jgi:hypothetical protein
MISLKITGCRLQFLQDNNVFNFPVKSLFEGEVAYLEKWCDL